MTPPIAATPDLSSIKTVEELFAHALQMEQEAAERYALLAEEMSAGNNREVAALFAKLAMIEGKHVAHINELSAGIDVPHYRPWDYKWEDGESPEAPSPEDVVYLMEPRAAIELAIQYEQRAVDFYAHVAEQTPDGDVRGLAAKLRDEEIEHVQMLRDFLARFAAKPAAWSDDPDEPVAQE